MVWEEKVAEAGLTLALAFPDFYRTARDPVARALAITLGDRDLAVEAVDEAMARAYQRWNQVSSFDNPGGWVYRVAFNWATSILRRRRRAADLPSLVDAGSVGLEGVGEPDVIRALIELDIRQRSVVVLPLPPRLVRSGDGHCALHPRRHRQEPPPPRHPAPRYPPRPPSPRGDLVNNLDRLLEDELHRQAARVPVPAGDLPGVMARSRRRRQHRMMAAVTTFAVVAAAIGGVAISRESSSRDVRVNIAAGNTGLRLGDAGIRWERSDPHSGLSYAYSMSAAGSLYALSTAPAVSDPNGPTSALYTSADGIEWTTAAGPSDLTLAGLAATGNRLYVVGTGSATSSIAAAKVGYSDDKSGTWHQTTLPIDTAAIAAKASTLNGEVVRIAAGPKGVVAVAVISTVLNVPKLLPAGWAPRTAGRCPIPVSTCSAPGPHARRVRARRRRATCQARPRPRMPPSGRPRAILPGPAPLPPRSGRRRASAVRAASPTPWSALRRRAA